MKLRLILPVLLLAILSMGGCVTPDPEHEHIQTTPPKPRNLPSKIYLYLDNSESMDGYMKSTDMSTFVDAIGTIGDFYRPKDVEINSFYLECEKAKNNTKQTKIVPVDFDDLRSKISSRKVKKTDSYAIDRFFVDVTTRLLEDSNYSRIAFFVTDGIMSGTNEEISNSLERRFNMDNATTLASRIAEALYPLSRNSNGAVHYGAAIYRFESGFNGEYFPYTNYPVPLNARRPFYIIAIGESSEVMRFDTAVNNGLNGFAPTHHLFLDQPQGKFMLLGEMVNNVSDNIVKLTYQKDKNAKSFDLFFRTNTLPGHLRDETNASNAIHIEFCGHEQKFIAKNGKVRFSIIPPKGEGGLPLKIIIDDCLPNWIEEYSSGDDISIRSQTGLTFMLNHLIDGIKMGIMGTGPAQQYNQWYFTVDNTDNY